MLDEKPSFAQRRTNVPRLKGPGCGNGSPFRLEQFLQRMYPPVSVLYWTIVNQGQYNFQSVRVRSPFPG